MPLPPAAEEKLYEVIDPAAAQTTLAALRERHAVLYECVGCAQALGQAAGAELVLVFGAIFGFVEGKKIIIARYLANYEPPPVTVSAEEARNERWDVVIGAVGTLKAGEAASISAIQGKESTRRVVEALMSAEQALQTAVAVRDKVVQAYQEVVRMSI